MAIIRTKKQNEISDIQNNINGIYDKAESFSIEIYPFDIESFLKRIGIIIVREDMDSDMSGYLEKRGNDWIVGVNQYQNPRRQRFTMAHELAHFILHKEIAEKSRINDMILFRSDETNAMEKQANEFASNLLIPSDNFKIQIANGITEINILSDLYNVSIAAIRYKAYKLNYLTDY